MAMWRKLKAPEVLVETPPGEALPLPTGKQFPAVSIGKDQCHHGERFVNLYGPGYITDYIGKCLLPHLPTVLLPGQSGADPEAFTEPRWSHAGLTEGKPCGIFTAVSGTISLFLAQKQRRRYMA